MATKKFSELPLVEYAEDLSETDYLPVVVGGVNKRVTVGILAGWTPPVPSGDGSTCPLATYLPPNETVFITLAPSEERWFYTPRGSFTTSRVDWDGSASGNSYYGPDCDNLADLGTWTGEHSSWSGANKLFVKVSDAGFGSTGNIKATCW